jgi:hypothetical protein
MSYQLNPDGSICWHCDSSWIADSVHRTDSLRWSSHSSYMEAFGRMTHSTLFWLVVIVAVGSFLLARSHTSGR